MQNYATWIQDSFIIHIKTEDVYEDIANDVEERFDTWNYAIEKPQRKGKNKKLNELMKEKLGGKIMIEFVGLRPKTYIYLIDDFGEDMKAKGTKNA